VEKQIDWMIDHFMQYKKIKIYVFEDTPPISNYLVTINAGAFKIYNHERTSDAFPP